MNHKLDNAHKLEKQYKTLATSAATYKDKLNLILQEKNVHAKGNKGEVLSVITKRAEINYIRVEGCNPSHPLKTPPSSNQVKAKRVYGLLQQESYAPPSSGV